VIEGLGQLLEINEKNSVNGNKIYLLHFGLDLLSPPVDVLQQ
jgi:hypothetical protein